MEEKGQRVDGGVEKSIKRLTSPKMVLVPGGTNPGETEKLLQSGESAKHAHRRAWSLCHYVPATPGVTWMHRGNGKWTGHALVAIHWHVATEIALRCDADLTLHVTSLALPMWVSGEWWRVRGEWWVHEHFKIKGVRSWFFMMTYVMTPTSHFILFFSFQFYIQRNLEIKYILLAFFFYNAYKS